MSLEPRTPELISSDEESDVDTGSFMDDDLILRTHDFIDTKRKNPKIYQQLIEGAMIERFELSPVSDDAEGQEIGDYDDEFVIPTIHDVISILLWIDEMHGPDEEKKAFLQTHGVYNELVKKLGKKTLDDFISRDRSSKRDFIPSLNVIYTTLKNCESTWMRDYESSS